MRSGDQCRGYPADDQPYGSAEKPAAATRRTDVGDAFRFHTALKSNWCCQLIWRVASGQDSLMHMTRPGQERRGFERVEYAPGERPVFLSGGGAFEVMDCAERGLRYVASADAGIPEVGSDIRGTVRFPDGPEVQVEGVVVRTGGGGVAINFTQIWIDKEVIERERRRLRGPGHFAR